MTDEGIHIGDTGTKIKLTIQRNSAAVDMSAWSFDSMQIRFEKPDGTLLSKDAAFDTDGSNGIIVVTTVDGDLSLTGRWKMQGYMDVTAPEGEVGTWHTDVVKFSVYDVVGGS